MEIGEKLLGVVRLSVLNGNFWDVELRKVSGRTWLEGGLQEFLEYHSVSPEYILNIHSMSTNWINPEKRFKKHLEEECGEEESTDISSAESEKEESIDIMEIPRTTLRKNFKQSRVSKKLRTVEESEAAASKKSLILVRNTLKKNAKKMNPWISPVLLLQEVQSFWGTVEVEPCRKR
ncbi:hypothetical protein GIB67_042040 [Kingdonia uniflora]|uniref:Uncharacterized protein n=1 Tax=Kingdonia uniflora TaxID=39325 RepID=A0A7J7MVJ3_9MAGN|nr:hypothetical protein GIB67_042040 [Kingdonia uniflora]